MGLTATGYSPTTLPELLSRVDTAARVRFGNDLDLTPQSLAGGMRDVFCNEMAILYEEQQAVYMAGSINSAEGVQLDDLMFLKGGYTRNAATKSFLKKQYFIGTDTTVIPKATQVYDSSNPEIIFETTEELTLGTGVDEIQSGTLSIGWESTYQQFRLSHGNYTTNWISFFATDVDIEIELNDLPSIDMVTVVTTGQPKITVTFNGWSGKQPQLPLYCEIKNAPGFNFYFTVETAGVAQGFCPIKSVVGGSDQVGPAYQVKDLVSTVSGVDYTINTLDVSLGKDIETDAQFKARAELFGLEAHLMDAIPELDRVSVFNNPSENTDVDGRPPHSFEVYAYSSVGIAGDITLQQEIANVIFKNTAGGIESVTTATTNYSATVYDITGLPHTVVFSEPDAINIYVSITLDISVGVFPTNGTQQVIDKILAYGNSLSVGDAVIYSPYLVGALLGIPGIKSSTVYCGLSASPTGQANIPIGNNQISSWDSTRIVVTIL